MSIHVIPQLQTVDGSSGSKGRPGLQDDPRSLLGLAPPLFTVLTSHCSLSVPLLQVSGLLAFCAHAQTAAGLCACSHCPQAFQSSANSAQLSPASLPQQLYLESQLLPFLLISLAFYALLPPFNML